MDDSRDTESSVGTIWAAEHSGDDSSSTGKVAFTIGELSREFGVTLRALRFYENKGLISPHRDGLSRLYSQGDRTRLALILKGKKLGFTLGEIRQMIAAEEGDADRDALTLSREKCLEQIEMLKRQKAEIEEGLNELAPDLCVALGQARRGDRQRRLIAAGRSRISAGPETHRRFSSVFGPSADPAADAKIFAILSLRLRKLDV